MKKEFVPYELALKLKELGFIEECLGFFYKEEDVIFETCSPYNANKTFNYISAPLWQQSFDFFRELGFEFSINYHEHYLKDSKKHVYEVNLEQRGNSIYHNITPLCGFTTYEEARLECLEKLIELCEKN